MLQCRQDNKIIRFLFSFTAFLEETYKTLFNKAILSHASMFMYPVFTRRHAGMALETGAELRKAVEAALPGNLADVQ